MKKELANSEKEAEILESNIYHLNVEIENLKSIQEEKEESLRSMVRAVLEEEKKVERAKVGITIDKTVLKVIVNC